MVRLVVPAGGPDGSERCSCVLDIAPATVLRLAHRPLVHRTSVLVAVDLLEWAEERRALNLVSEQSASNTGREGEMEDEHIFASRMQRALTGGAEGS